MYDPKKLQEILSQQKYVMAQLEQEANAILNADLTKENEKLKNDLALLQADFSAQSEKLRAATTQNTEIKNALYEQIFNEKIAVLDRSQQKNAIFFGAHSSDEFNRLTRLQLNLQKRSHEIKERITKYSIDNSSELIEKFNDLSAQVDVSIEQAKAELLQAYEEHAAYSKEKYDELKNEQITDYIVASVSRKNNFEAFIGGNLLNKAGIVFIILGIIAISQIVVTQMPDTLRAAIMFAVAGLFLVGGEILNRRKANIFSLGVTSAGIAGLYVSLGISYFAFGVIGLIPAAVVCVLISAVAFVLSTRYNSQTIAAFALIGGYIPIIIGVMEETAVVVFSVMGYAVVLNLFNLALSFYKKWRITMFVGFGFNVISTMIILFALDSLWHRSNAGSISVYSVLAILYVIFVFAVYNLVPMIGSYKNKLAFGNADVTLLAINTVISAIFIFSVLGVFGLSRFHGLAAIVFAVIYIALCKIMGRFFASEVHTKMLFYITGLTFVVLVVPFQFGVQWWSLGWLVQGVLMACYGILADAKTIRRTGFIIGGLCLAVFVMYELPMYADNFIFRYLAITLGSVLVLAAFIYKRQVEDVVRAYKYAVLINIWIYAVYVTYTVMEIFSEPLRGTSFSYYFLMNAAMIVLAFLFAAALMYLPIIRDKGTRIISICVAIFGIGYLMFGIGVEQVVERGSSVGLVVVATIILCVLCGFAILAMRSVLMFFVMEVRMPVEWLPFGVSAFFLVLLTQSLIVQYRIDFTSMVFSIIYVVAALAWIIFGFVKRYMFMRRFGLVLTILAVGKLFLVDLQQLTDASRIVSFFAFGATLLGISFVYQYFSKHFAVKLGLGDEPT